MEDNKDKYIKMLGDKQSVCLEVYNDHSNRIDFVMPMQQADKFNLTKLPKPTLKSEQQTEPQKPDDLKKTE